MFITNDVNFTITTDHQGVKIERMGYADKFHHWLTHNYDIDLESAIKVVAWAIIFFTSGAFYLGAMLGLMVLDCCDERPRTLAVIPPEQVRTGIQQIQQLIPQLAVRHH